MKKEASRKYIVYKHTSPDGKVYIGVTCRKPEDRWAKGHGYFNNEHFKRAILKYGWDNFKHDILFSGLSKEDAYDKEISLIREHNSTDQNYGYNHHNGGAGSHVGVVCKEETRIKRSQKMKGKFKGKYIGGKSSRARKINQYSLEGELIKTWDSSMDAERGLGIGYSGIIKCCTGKAITSGGFIWTYAENADNVMSVVQKLQEPKKLPQEHKDKIRRSMLGKTHDTLAKPIVATHTETGETVYYKSISETKKDGFNPQNVSKCLSDKYPYSKTLKGFRFEFAT